MPQGLLGWQQYPMALPSHLVTVPPQSFWSHEQSLHSHVASLPGSLSDRLASKVGVKELQRELVVPSQTPCDRAP